MVSDVVVVPVLLATLGVAGIYTGWKRRGIHAQMAALDPTPVRELAEPGPVEVTGSATPADAPLSAPVTGRDAVLAAWTIEEWDERGDKSRWREVARGIELAPCEVDDGTGSVRVAPVSKRDTAGKWTQTTGVSASDGVRIDDVLAEFDAFPTQTELGPDEDLPERLHALHEDHGLYEDTGSVTNAVDVGTKHGRRRYAEQVVEPGADVYVLGRVEARDGSERFRPGEAVLTRPDEGVFVVSNQDEASLEAEFGAGAKRRIVGGAVSLLAGLAGLGYLLWPA